MLFRSDLVGPGLLAGAVTRPTLAYEAGHIRPPSGAGLGVQLDEGRMEAFAA